MPSGFRRRSGSASPSLPPCRSWRRLSGGDRLRAWREEARPLPPPGRQRPPDRAGHGGRRPPEPPRLRPPTSPTIDELAARDPLRSGPGDLVVDAAIAREHVHGTMAPRALRRLAHPARRAHPTLAEFLGSRGYATAGFIANPGIASRLRAGSGFHRLIAITSSRAHRLQDRRPVDRPLTARAVDELPRGLAGLRSLEAGRAGLLAAVKGDRKEAAEVNREFLDWLSRRRQPERPFFAFLNFYDAHYPYQLPAAGIHRFGAKPRDHSRIAT